MATSPLGGFANLSRYQAEAAAPSASPLDALIQGFNQGQVLQQLPQIQAEQVLTRQLNNAILAQKLQDLQNPQAALARKIQEELTMRAALNPDLGITTAPAGLQGQTIGNPSAIGETEQSLNALLANNPNAVIPSAAAKLPETPIAIGNIQTGLNLNPNIPAQASQEKQNRILEQINTKAENASQIQQMKNEFGAQSLQTKKDIADEANRVKKEIADAALAAKQGGTQQDLTSIPGDVQDVLEGRNTLFNIRQTLGRSNQSAQYMQALRSEVRKFDPKFDFVASDAGGKTFSSTFAQKGLRAIDAVLPNIDKIIDLSNQVDRIGVAGVDNLLQKAGVQFGNTKVANLRQAQKLLGDELGVALGAGNVSDMKLRLGLDITDPSLSQEAFASNLGLVKEFLHNRRDALAERYKSSTVSSPVGTPGINPQGTNPVQPATLGNSGSFNGITFQKISK